MVAENASGFVYSGSSGGGMPIEVAVITCLWVGKA